jgi:hypothetical protein
MKSIKLYLIIRKNFKIKKYKSIISYRTIIWLGEEIHKVNCEQNMFTCRTW